MQIRCGSGRNHMWLDRVLEVDQAEGAGGDDHLRARVGGHADALGRQTFYNPPERGFEREIRKRIEYWNRLRVERGE